MVGKNENDGCTLLGINRGTRAQFSFDHELPLPELIYFTAIFFRVSYRDGRPIAFTGSRLDRAILGGAWLWVIERARVVLLKRVLAEVVRRRSRSFDPYTWRSSCVHWSPHSVSTGAPELSSLLIMSYRYLSSYISIMNGIYNGG
jgi:hypothetical protein